MKAVRLSKGMSISDLAKKSGVSRPTIYRLEDDEETTVNSGTLKALADALEVSVTAFFSDTV